MSATHLDGYAEYATICENCYYADQYTSEAEHGEIGDSISGFQCNRCRKHCDFKIIQKSLNHYEEDQE